MDNKEFLGTEKISKLLFKLAVPSVVAQLVNLLYNMVDRVYIGHMAEVGSLALTGVGVCMPVIMLVSAFACLVGMGGAPQVSICMGKKEYDKAEKIMGNCLIFLIAISIILTATFLIFGERLLMVFGASANTIGFAMDYMRIYVLGTIFVQLALGMNMFITCQGFTKVSMMSVVIGAVLNIILDPILIFVFDLGVKGAALATIISQAVSAVWVVSFLSGKKTGIKLKKKYFRIDFKVLAPCIGLGVSPFIMQATESVINVCFNSSLLKYGGDLAVGAMTVLATVMQFSMLPLQGLTQGAQPITSYNYGAGNPKRVKESFSLLLKVCLAYSMILWILIMLMPDKFVMMFNSNPNLVEYGSWAMRIYFAVSGIFGIQIACQQTFIAIGNAKTSLFLAILRKILLLIPLIYILPMFFENKAMAVYMAEPFADAIAVLTTAILFTKSFRKTINKMEKSNNNSEVGTV
ncbi:MAG: MATE family efflux transporter [Clostridiales bacterium]|nr:MATE family efflux transporter [Clostridiales bacterium]